MAASDSRRGGGRGAAPPRRDSRGDTARKKKKPVTPVEDDDGVPAGGGGGSVKTWTIRGVIEVRESETTRTPEDRPLVGIAVEISASDIGADGPWTEWGKVTTDAQGQYELRHEQRGASRFFRVRCWLGAPDFEVATSRNDEIAHLDLLGQEWRIVWKSNRQLEGPVVDVPPGIIQANGAWDLGIEQFRRQAVVYYAIRTVIDRLRAEDPWFAFKYRFAAIYPAHVISGVSYANGHTRMIYLHKGDPDNDWMPDVAIHEAMHIWNYDHNQGTTNWFGALCSLRGEDPVDLTTHNQQENKNVAFHEGFASWASNALRHELWGQRKEKPLRRKWVFEEMGLETLEMVEKSDGAVARALHLLQSIDSAGWWGHLFGTREEDPPGTEPARPAEVGKAYLKGLVIPPGKRGLTLWDVLRTFRANPAAGWPTEWQVGNVDFGILRFIERAADIHALGEDVRLMLNRCLDPLADNEPMDELEKVPPPRPGAERPPSEARPTTPARAARRRPVS